MNAANEDWLCNWYLYEDAISVEPVPEFGVPLCQECQNRVGGAVPEPDFIWRAKKRHEICAAADCS